jgi:hypothetical protein
VYNALLVRITKAKELRARMQARPYESKDIQILLGECGTAHALKNGERLGQAKKTNSLFMVWNRLGLGAWGLGFAQAKKTNSLFMVWNRLGLRAWGLGFGQAKGWVWAATALCVKIQE